MGKAMILLRPDAHSYDCSGGVDSLPIGEFREPLEESAPLARRLAPSLCRRDPATGESCAWTHGFWQYLRLMGLASGPGRHEKFFRGAFDRVEARSGAPRVLISGTADYSMLAHVLGAFRARSIEPEVTVLDLCETPLALSRWYAERVACRIRTWRGDVLAYRESGEFDAVCTHSFLSYFSPESRPDLLARWRELLRPGGRAITVNALRPGPTSERVGLSRAQALALRENVQRWAEANRSTLQFEPLDLVREAEIYAARLGFWRVQSGEEIRGLLERSGFRVDQLTCGPAVLPLGPRSEVTGPTSPANTEYVHVLATRV
jgi:SAM-dependent methyltransferase